ncbi:MAG: hypothetical protein QME51_07310 [Planctomycetota bacterium]|nr:hypothetical protein [Planctomycetota bacterium]
MTSIKDSDKISLFLDTSIPISQITKGEDFRRRIDYLLSQFRWLGISSYTQLEYGNRVLDECEYLIKTFNRLGSFRRTLDWITNDLPSQWQRKRTITLNLLHRIYGNNDNECTERALYELTDLMELGTNFVQNCYSGKAIDEVRDGTRCYWTQRALVSKKDGLHWIRPTCKKEIRRCNIDKFFTDNIQIFSTISSAISQLTNPSQELTNFKTIIDSAKVNSTTLLDYKNCKALADAIIAVDSSGYKSFFSQNIKESQTLCSVMNQILYYLPPNFNKGIEVYDQSGKLSETIKL